MSGGGLTEAVQVRCLLKAGAWLIAVSLLCMLRWTRALCPFLAICSPLSLPLTPDSLLQPVYLVTVAMIVSEVQRLPPIAWKAPRAAIWSPFHPPFIRFVVPDDFSNEPIN